MLRRLLILALSAALGSGAAWGQIIRGGYEWITVGQPYVRVATSFDGMYRVSGALIIGADPRLNGVPIAQVKMLFRGQQVPIYVSPGNNPAAFDADDVIEFYGRRNDGHLDSLMYRNPSTGAHDPNGIPNARKSLVSDTAAFFVTADAAPSARFMPVITTTVSGTPELHYRHESFREFIEVYHNGGASSFDYNTTLNAEYTPGEGWVSATFGTGSVRVDSLRTRHRLLSAAEPPQLLARVVGSTATAHITRLEVGASAQTFNHAGLNVNTFSVLLQVSDLGPFSTAVRILPQAPGIDLQRVAWLALSYDRLFRFDGEREVLIHRWTNPTGTERQLRLEGLDFASVADSGYVFDLTYRRRLRGQVRIGPGGRDTLIAMVPGSLGDHRLVAVASSAFRVIEPTAVRRARMAGTWRPDQGTPMIVLSMDNIGSESFRDQAVAYAQYRSTSPVNPVPAQALTVSQLMDEYGYGTNSPIIVKRFIRSVWENWTVKPRYLLMTFKSFGFTVYPAGPIPFEDPPLPPTWGFPASDWQLVTNFNFAARDNTPLVAVGRVSVTSAQNFQHYFDKVRETEAAAYDDWRKQVVHLGGGTTLGEQNSIRASLEGQLEPIVEGQPIAARVFYHQKSSTATVGAPIGQQLTNLMESGVSMLNFFGHSTSNLFDIDLQRPFAYNNAGRYPFIIANGCYGGNFAQGGPASFGEEYIFTPNRGAIGYLAMSGPGSIPNLSQLNQIFYRVAFVDSVGQRVGDLQREAVRRYAVSSPNNNPALNHAMQFNLQGDPSLRLHFPRQADLAVVPGDIRVLPTDATALSDSFEVQVSVRNRGLVVSDSFTVTLQHTVVATGRTVILPPRRMRIALGEDSVRFRIRREGADFSGDNRFSVTVDPANQVTEFDESNNSATNVISLVSDLPLLLEPAPFALINQDTVSLVAARYSVMPAGPVTYLFEVDTVPGFNSPRPASERQSPPMTGTAVGARWRVPFSLENGRVYYWRARISSAPADRWATGSFRYVAGPEVGWQQSTVPQLGRNSLNGVVANVAQRRLDFSEQPALLRISFSGPLNKAIFFGGSRITEQGFSESGSAGTWLAVIDGRNGRLKLSFSAQFGFVQLHDAAPGFPTLVAQVNAAAAPGDWVLLFCPLGNTGVDLADPAFAPYQALFTSLGATQALFGLPISTPYAVVGRRGATVGTATEVFGPPAPIFDRLLPFAAPSGGLVTAPIGPVSSWGSLSWSVSPRELPDNDQATLRLYGIRADGTDSLVAMPPPGILPLASLDARRFPQARLELSLRDDTSRTPPRIDQLKLVYAPAPDLTWDPNASFVFESTPIDQGIEGRLQLTARNRSRVAIDSTWASLSVLRADGVRVSLGQRRLPPLAPGATSLVNYRVPTTGLSGSVVLSANLNPPPGPTEQTLVNNSFTQLMEVRSDSRHPLLDVTFDGRYIGAGDIIAPQPEIIAQLRDDHPVNALSDTNAIRVRLKRLPSDGTPSLDPPRDLHYSLAAGTPNPELEFIPSSGTGANNRARVIYRPQAFADGEYLLEVQGRDAAGNLAGLEPYRIQFRVVNASTITHVVNYPNPFSTSTRFVYTLTGSAIPEVFQVHIYTVTGRLVKVIDLKASGDVRIGTNISEAAWDGTDEFGDRLANGVYLYKLVMEMPGETGAPQLDDRNTAQFFKGGWGKMVLMR